MWFWALLIFIFTTYVSLWFCLEKIHLLPMVELLKMKPLKDKIIKTQWKMMYRVKGKISNIVSVGMNRKMTACERLPVSLWDGAGDNLWVQILDDLKLTKWREDLETWYSMHRFVNPMGVIYHITSCSSPGKEMSCISLQV